MTWCKPPTGTRAGQRYASHSGLQTVRPGCTPADRIRSLQIVSEIFGPGAAGLYRSTQ